MAAQNAVQNPLITKPGATSEARSNSTALMIRVKNPRVSQRIGNVNSFRIGPIEQLMRPMTTEANAAYFQSSTSTSLKSTGRSSRAKVEMTHRIARRFTRRTVDQLGCS